MFEELEHAPEVCEPGCTLKHCFCTVQLRAPHPKGLVPVELCIDLHPRLQVATFRGLFADQRQAVPLEVRLVLSSRFSFVDSPPA